VVVAFVFYSFAFTPAGGAYLTDTSVTDSNGVNFRMHDINRIELWITNTGIIAHNSSGTDYGCGWPKGEGHIYFTRTGFWFGTVDEETGDTLVSSGYQHGQGYCEYRPGLSGQDPKSDITAIYMYPYRWPPPRDSFPMAPSKAVSHQDSWCVFNDSAPEYHNTRPIGIEVYQTGYAWNYTLAQDMIYMIFEARNVSDRTLRRNYLGFSVELHIGSDAGTGDDIISAIPRRWYQFANGDSALADNIGYGWQEADQPGWDPPVPGVVSFDLLQTPYDLRSGQDKDSDGIPDLHERDSAYYYINVPHVLWDADSDYIPDWRDASQNPQVGMSAFKRLIPLYNLTRDPERYLALAGYNYQTGIYEPFDTIPSAPDDKQFVISSGPFDLMPDSSTVLVLGIILATWMDIYETPDTALVMIDRWMQQIWDELYFESGVSRLPRPVWDSIAFVISPNPSTNQAIATLTLTEPRDVELRLFDVCGRIVLDLNYGSLEPGKHLLAIDSRGLAAGTYFVICRLNGGAALLMKPMVVVR
jgi:hypothetical protein